MIVADFGVGVNEYAAFGRQIPIYKPSSCPKCGATGLRSHGVRRRVAWLALVALLLYVRRLRCASRAGCGATFTVLPHFLHPRRRYVLDEFQRSIDARVGEGQSFAAMEKELPEPPAPSTRREWVTAFEAAAARWLAELTGWFTKWNPAAVLARASEKGPAPGLVAMAIPALDWIRSQRGQPPVDKSLWLQELWLWGAVRCGQLFGPTRNRAGPPRPDD